MRLALVLAVLLGGAAGPAVAPAAAQSAIPIERFHRVDEGLYRGAQPSVEGFRRLFQR